jgi:hypothetical protein
MQALMCALPLVVSAAASSTIWRDEQARIGELPGSLRCSLHLLHTNDAARPGGKKPNSFSAYEDAILLLQHVRDGVPLPSVQLPPPRKSRAAKDRWQVLKKCLPPSELHELRMQAPTTSRDEEQARIIGELPGPLRCSLHLLHANVAARPGGKNPDSFSAYEDASLLLQHVRDGVPLPSVQLPPRKPGAAKNRWKQLKKCLPASELHELRMQSKETQSNETTGDGRASWEELLLERMREVGLKHLSPHMQEALLRGHVNGELGSVVNRTHRPWSIEEDARLLEEHVAGEPTEAIDVAGRSAGAKRRRLQRLRAKLSVASRAFVQAHCHPELPPLHLKAHEWTRMHAD